MEVAQDWSNEWEIHDSNLVEAEPVLRLAIADALELLAQDMRANHAFKSLLDNETQDDSDTPDEWRSKYEA